MAIVEDTYAEAFDGIYSSFLVTALNRKWLQHALNCVTGYATSTIGCGCESGLDRYLEKEHTPDNRVGALIQAWMPAWEKNAADVLEKELIGRIGQCVLTAPSTRVFDYDKGENTFYVGKKLAFFGDGYQRKENRFGREMAIIPLMSGEFLIEEQLSYSTGVMGGNLWFMGKSLESALEAAEKAVEAISKVKGVITPFPGGVCGSGSKVGSRYSFLVASTNHCYCPSIKEKVDDAGVPKEVESITEVIINGINAETVQKAMYKGVKASRDTEDLVKITAGNYGGELGKHRLFLRK